MIEIGITVVLCGIGAILVAIAICILYDFFTMI